ncbi:MAG TPA: MBL fold metallo-hydrolase [Moraxellaceae bacterium]|nr:MBL fold metallo-hydrolase [Moraxellaceae bacterium]
MPYRIIPVTPFEQNCTLLWCDDTREAAVVDPGGDLDRIRAAIAVAGVTVTQVLLTHAHIDHAGGAAEFAESAGVPIVGPHQGDQFWIDGLARQARMFGFPEARPFVPDRWLAQGDEVQVGRLALEVRHCPGHTPGHVVFWVPAENLVIVGDVLFAGSIGRTDFPGGDFDTLVRSIREQLFTLGDDVAFIPGHGPMSTIGEERRSNPFVADKRYG